MVSVTDDTSPAKWHLAHTSWFFERFVLSTWRPGRSPFHPQYDFLFNSYYEGLGNFLAKPERNFLSRPSIDEILRYRESIEHEIQEFLNEARAADFRNLAPILELGLHHEQQHQELLLMDTKRNFYANPLRPAYRSLAREDGETSVSQGFREFPGGLTKVGAECPAAGFAFDNERPRHREWLEPFAIAESLVTNGDFLEFIEDGGYATPTLWLSDGWDWKEAGAIAVPLYWEKVDGGWSEMTLGGMRWLSPSQPVAHLSYYEADAFARWRGSRLPTEAEWERAAADAPVDGPFLDLTKLHPASANGVHGTLWQWTSTSYGPYPGYRAFSGPLAEYNGKFMGNQMVLRGGSCVTPRSHYRVTYRNFFYPQQRWQFAGLRLAKDIV